MSSEQSCVRKGKGYDEVYSSSQDDPDTSYDERIPSANSPSMEEDEDLDANGSKGDSGGDSNSEDVDNAEPPVQSVIGPDGLREFLHLPLWTVNDCNSTIKKNHFKTLRERYQIPINILIHLPFKLEKCYYQDAKGVEVYEQMFKVGFRFSLSALHCHLLQYLGLAVTQISLNAWRVFLGAEVLYGVLTNGVLINGERKMMVEEFFHCYRPSKITQSRGMYNILTRKLALRLVCDIPNSNRNWKSQYFFIQGEDLMCHLEDQKYIPMDKTWGIMPPSDRCSSGLNFVYYLCHVSLTVSILQLETV